MFMQSSLAQKRSSLWPNRFELDNFQARTQIYYVKSFHEKALDYHDAVDEELWLTLACTV